jgi:hexosaminidase
MKTGKTLFLIMLFVLQIGSVSAQKNEYNIIPKPQQLKPAAGQFTFNAQTGLYLATGADSDVAGAFEILSEHLQQAAGFTFEKASSQHNAIVCKINQGLSKTESYKLQIESNKITIEASAPVGFFYAAQTIRQLLPAEIESTALQTNVKWAVPCCTIEDAPRYDYRGMHLDVSRHFSTKEQVMQYIDQIAYLKLNTFHWHLTDDQGWRIEIKKYPKLTTIGGFRNRTIIGNHRDVPPRWDNTVVGGFYTQDEVKEVLAYATKRFVTILPEIEMPGHAVAALAAYPNLSCTGGPFEVEGTWGVFNDVYCSREATFKFLEDVLDEVAELFPYEYIHIGGDECPKERWKHCAACQARMKEEGLKNEHELQAWFVGRIGQYLATKGKRIIGWDEILEGGLLEKDKSATVMSWRGTEGGITAARLDHDVIMTPHTSVYLDYHQVKHQKGSLSIGHYLPLSKVYQYDPVPAELTPAEAQHILGVQANVWTEYMPTQDNREFMIYPRMLALAEIAWLDNNKKDYKNFTQRLTALLKHYDVIGIKYCKE